MAGIVQGAVAGSLFTLSLVYFTKERFHRVGDTVHESLTSTNNIIKHRNDPVVPRSNVQSYMIRDWKEGSKDIWNEEVIRAVNWVYGLDIAGAAVGLIESTVTLINEQVHK